MAVPFYRHGVIINPNLACRFLPRQPLWGEFDAHPPYNHAQRQAMIHPDRIEQLVAAGGGAVLGTVTAYGLGHERLGILIWALAGAVVVSGLVYCLRFFRR